MRLTTALIDASFAAHLHVMKKIASVVLVLIVLLNAAILLPKACIKTEGEEECSVIKRPKIELTEVPPGILPNLLKSTSFGF